jgi:uncharacterized protein YndB with AHSA1/START domain
MKSLKLKIATTIAAKPDVVFAALTDAKTIGQWSGQKGMVASSVGGAFEMFDGWVKGKVLEYKPGKTLAYTWHTEDWTADTEPSVVRYTFAAVKEGTKIVLEHSNFPNENEMKTHKSGWKEHVFDPLKDHFSK